MVRIQRCCECWHWIPCEIGGEKEGFCFCWKEAGKQVRLAKDGKDCEFFEEIPRMEDEDDLQEDS